MAIAGYAEESKVTGAILSDHQFSHACNMAAAAGLDSRVNFHLRDYREQTGHFDKVVSVGLLEYVGPQGYANYFLKIRALLADYRIAVIHTIGMQHKAGPVNRWITKYIFPGGYLPSIGQMNRHTEKCGLNVLDMEVMRGHYAETLRLWRIRFLDHRAAMRRLYDACFVRMWEFYLVGCEYFSRRQHVTVLQL